MTQARIQIDSVTGSNPPNGTALALGATVAITNVNNGGEVTYLWEWLDRPENSAAAFANPAVQTTSFVADVEGTYVIRLTVNAALSDERTDIVIAAVSQLLTVERIPGAYETTQANTLRGWAEAANRLFRRVDGLAADSGKLIGVCASGANRGQVLIAETADLIRAGLPEEELVAGYGLAIASNLASMQAPLYVVEGTPAGGTTVGVGALAVVRSVGLFGPLSGAPTLGDPVYVNDSAQLSLTAGTYTRRVGTVVWEDGTDYYVFVQGSAYRIALNNAAVLVDDTTAPADFPSAVPIQAIPNSGLTFVGPGGWSDAHTIAAFEPSDPINTVRITGQGSVELGEGGAFLGADGENLHVRAKASRRVILTPDADPTLSWSIMPTTGSLTAAAVGGQFIRNVKFPTDSTDAATKQYVDRMGEVYRFGNSAIVVGGGASYLDPWWHRAIAAGDAIPVEVTHTGRLVSLRVRARVAGSGDSVVFTVYKNGAATAAVATLVAAATSVTAAITPDIGVAAGDLLTVEVVAGATTVSPADIVVAITAVRTV